MYINNINWCFLKSTERIKIKSNTSCGCLRKVKQTRRRGCDGLEMGRDFETVGRANECEAADQAGGGVSTRFKISTQVLNYRTRVSQYLYYVDQ